MKRVEYEELGRIRSTGFSRETWSIPGLGEEWTIPVVHRSPAVCVVPVRELAGGGFEVLLVSQPRPAVREVSLVECVAGKVDPDEDPESTARRELTEETGYSAESLTRLAPLPWQVSPGYSDELMHVFLATGLTEGEQRPEDAHIAVEWVRLDYAVLRVVQGELTDMKSAAAILLVAARLSVVTTVLGTPRPGPRAGGEFRRFVVETLEAYDRAVIDCEGAVARLTMALGRWS